MANKKRKPYAALRDFPSVEILSNHPALAAYIPIVTRPLVVTTVRSVISRLKTEFTSGGTSVGETDLIGAVTAELDRLAAMNLAPVINATGIVIHTNLGRAPISEKMITGALGMVSGYSNLEFDLISGRRGQRGVLAERLLAALCDTEAGTIVNNNAAALFIILNTLAWRKEVVISRGELVQIGGGFRIPDIMKKSGAKVVEVGTTNRTTLDDYAGAVTERTGMILKVHRSNFTQVGFVEETPLPELAGLCRRHQLILTYDLGSGLISFPPDVPITGEPSVSESVRAGADITCFSGDKLLGGTQAGLIAGRSDVIARIKKNPLFRTVRCDKLVFAIITQVFAAYLNGTQFTDIPVWEMITCPLTDLKKRGEAIRRACPGRDIGLVATEAFLGGGSTPGQTIPSLAVSLRSKIGATALAKRFRAFAPPIIGRVDKDDFLIDLRTIPPGKDQVIITAIEQILE